MKRLPYSARLMECSVSLVQLKPLEDFLLPIFLALDSAIGPSLPLVAYPTPSKLVCAVRPKHRLARILATELVMENTARIEYSIHN